MLVHLGQNYTALNKDVELVLDYKNIEGTPINMNFLKNIEKDATSIHIDNNTKSVIITKKGDSFTVYYSPIKPDTLFARSSANIF